MPAFLIPDVQPLNKVPLHQGFFLLILNAGKKPPHIAIIINSKVYSLTYKGRQMGDPVDALIRSVNSKLIKTLIFELTLPLHSTLAVITETMEKSLSAYRKAEAGGVTCLAPVKDLFKRVYAISVQKVDFVFELLPLLYQHKIIAACYHLNMEKEIEENKYHFQPYTMQEINANINSLNQNPVL